MPDKEAKRLAAQKVLTDLKAALDNPDDDNFYKVLQRVLDFPVKENVTADESAMCQSCGDYSRCSVHHPGPHCTHH